MDIINEILWQSLVIFLWAGSVVAVVMGLAMLFAPDKARKVNRFFARWIDTRQFEMVLDRPRLTERFIYRHHRLAGTILSGCSLYVLYKFLLNRPAETIGAIMANDHFGLWGASVALFVIGGVLGSVIGLLMFMKPSLLREIEDASNKWISTDRFSDLFNHAHTFVDEALFTYRKTVGIVLTFSGGYIFYKLGLLLLNGRWVF